MAYRSAYLSKLAIIALAVGLLFGDDLTAVRQSDISYADGASRTSRAGVARDRFVDVGGSMPGANLSQMANAGLVGVSGHVRDEAGVPVPGAGVRLRDVRTGLDISTVTDGTGAFSASVPAATTQLWIVASHPDFGLQWTGSVGATIEEPGWTGFQRTGAIPKEPVDLVLRRGVVLRGRLLDGSGQALAGDAIFLVPAYIGSGPSKIEAATDKGGRFAFGRAVLSQFELVPRSLDQWRPHEPGDYLRITQMPKAWLEVARSNGSIDVRAEAYTLIPVSIDVTALRTSSVQVWQRRGSGSSGATVLKVDPTGRVQTTMERGIEHELWVVPGTGLGMIAPWTRGIRRNWIGTPTGPLALTIPRASPP